MNSKWTIRATRGRSIEDGEWWVRMTDVAALVDAAIVWVDSSGTISTEADRLEEVVNAMRTLDVVRRESEAVAG